MFGAIKGYFFGDSSTQQSNSLKENKPLKSDISNSNLDSKKEEKKRTIIKGEKNKFDFSEEYDEDEPKSTSSENENEKKIKNEFFNEIELNPAQKLDSMDYWRMAHCVYVKNSLININTLNYVPFIKLKNKKEGLLSYIGFGSDTSFEVKYLVGFDEHFIYMIDLSKEENKDDNDAMKTIGNHYDITKISNIEIIKDNSRDKIVVTILFVLDNDVDNFNSKVKKFYFEKQNALKFLKLLKAYLNNYKKKITFNDKVFGDINFNEIKNNEKKEKEKIVLTKEIKLEDKNEEKEENENNKNNEKLDNDGKDNKKEEESEKEEKRQEKEEKEEEANEQKKEKENKVEEEEFTSENVDEKDIEKENKKLIDI